MRHDTQGQLVKIRLLIVLPLFSPVTTIAQPASNSNHIIENTSTITQIDNTDNSVTISQIDSSKIATITQIGSENDIHITNGNKTTISQTGNQNVVNSADTHLFRVYQLGDSNAATLTGNSGSVVIRQDGCHNISDISQ